MSIQITCTDESDAIRLAVTGDVDMTTGHRLERELLRAERRGDRIVVDLRAVEFFDSTGLQILLDADLRAHENGHHLVVVPGDGEAARVLELTQVADRLTVAVIE